MVRLLRAAYCLGVLYILNHVMDQKKKHSRHDFFKPRDSYKKILRVPISRFPDLKPSGIDLDLQDIV